MTGAIAAWVVAAAVTAVLISALALRLSRLALLIGSVAVAVALAVNFAFGPRSLLLDDGVLLLASGMLGGLAGRGLAGLPALVAFCSTAAIIDVVSFLGGPTHLIIDAFRRGGGHALMALSFSGPLPDGRVVPLVGIGDLVIVCMLYAALRRMGCSAIGAAAAPVCGLAVALAAGLMMGGTPALPFIGGATVLYATTMAKRSNAIAVPQTRSA